MMNHTLQHKLYASAASCPEILFGLLLVVLFTSSLWKHRVCREPASFISLHRAGAPSDTHLAHLRLIWQWIESLRHSGVCCPMNSVFKHSSLLVLASHKTVISAFETKWCFPLSLLQWERCQRGLLVNFVVLRSFKQVIRGSVLLKQCVTTCRILLFYWRPLHLTPAKSFHQNVWRATLLMPDPSFCQS